MPSIVLFSGAIASGKTTLANELIEKHGFSRLKSSDHLRAICDEREIANSRTSLQAIGDELDVETDFKWLVSDVARPQIRSNPNQQRWLIDAVRKERQIEHFRSEFGDQVLHVHITAPEDTLRERFQSRVNSAERNEGGTTYDEAIAHPNEQFSRALSAIADVEIDLNGNSPAEAAAIVIQRLAKGA